MKTLQCSHCGASLEAGVERCPQCLRKHTAREVVPRGRVEVVRWAFLLGAWLLCVPVAWLHSNAQPWFEAHGAWLSATLFLAAVILLPPRFAFSELLRGARWRDAAGALGMVWSFAAVLAVAVWFASRFTDNPSVAVLAGLIVFLAPLLLIPPVVTAVRQGTSRRRALRVGVLRFAGVSAAIVTLFGVRLLTAPKPKPPLVIVQNPKALVDPFNLEGAKVERRWLAGADGRKSLHIGSEAEPFERAVLKMKSELINALSELDQTADAAPVVTLWVPPRFQSAPASAEIAKESDLLNEVLTKSKRKTQRGEPVRVVISFGELPAAVN
jgi:hypothetical protein